ncbi:MAG: type II secretion system protein [Marinagarivorans sp.]|nr:type II secretion system protein [Marinagarivorans sp.]
MIKQRLEFKKQAGFTLIELVAVIVILGILAATAVPRFVNLQDAASQAAVNGVAGSIESASALNHAVAVAVAAGLTTLLADPFYTVENCTDAWDLLQGGQPSGYTTVDLGSDIAAGAAGTCTLTGSNSKTATFSLIGAANGN